MTCWKSAPVFFPTLQYCTEHYSRWTRACGIILFLHHQMRNLPPIGTVTSIRSRTTVNKPSLTTATFDTQHSVSTSVTCRPFLVSRCHPRPHRSPRIHPKGYSILRITSQSPQDLNSPPSWQFFPPRRASLKSQTCYCRPFLNLF